MVRSRYDEILTFGILLKAYGRGISRSYFECGGHEDIVVGAMNGCEYFTGNIGGRLYGCILKNNGNTLNAFERL